MNGGQPPRTLLVAVLLCTALLLPVAGAQTQQPGFGQLVGSLTNDGKHVLSTSDAPTQVMYNDGDSDNTLDSGEQVFLARGSDARAGDVRLANPISGSVGSKVTDSSTDQSFTLTSLSGTLRYVDADGSGSFAPPDVLYYDLSGTGDNQVSINDVTLTGSNAGKLVTSGAQYQNVGLSTLTSTSLGFHDADNDGTYDTNEAMIVDTNGDSYVTVGDARLGPSGGQGFGSIVKRGESDVTYVLESPSPSLEFRFRDKNTNNLQDSDEAAYLAAGSQVSTYAVRLVTPSGVPGSPGSQVVETDSDWNIPTATLSGSLAFRDANNDGDLDSGETVYYDLSGTGSGQISQRDVILSGGQAGTLVVPGNSAIGTGLTGYGGTVLFFDADGNDVYNGGDIVYLDTDNDQLATQFDVQVSRPSTSGGGSGSPTTPTAPTISINQPAAGSYHFTNDTVTISGSASGGSDTISSVTLTVDGTSVTVSGTSTWTASYTPTSHGSHQLQATVTDSGGETATASRTIHANQYGEATKQCPNGDTIPTSQTCPSEQQSGTDPQAREDAEEAKQSAEEAKQSAQEAKEAAENAQETAQEAKEAAEGARDTAQNNSGKLDQLINLTAEEGVPGPGALVALLVVGLVAAAARRRGRR